MDRVRLGHGSGGKMMHDLIADHFGPAFGMEQLGDSAVLGAISGRIAFTTDSYVVSPLFFPGGDIGDLAVYGTVNDLAVSGAEPLYLSAGFIIEEGFAFDDLRRIVLSMSRAAAAAGVRVVAGDTKVVNKGKGDGIFINTAGIGMVRPGVEISPRLIRAGDKVIISGEIANHGIAVIAERNGISFEPPVVSDTRPLNGLVGTMMEIASGIRFMRDPTRGGLATTLKEVSRDSGLCIRIREAAIPLPARVAGACDLLGFDPLYVANEGILIAIVDPAEAERLVSTMKRHAFGAESAIIGEVVESPASMVLLETAIGGTRIVDMLPGEQLPRIC